MAKKSKARAKTKAKKPRAAKKPRVVKVALPRDAILKIVAPPGIKPVVAATAPGVVEIVPLPVEKKTWWDKLIGA